jgi:hypothetical protein
VKRRVSQFTPAVVRYPLRGAAKILVLVVLAASVATPAAAQRTLASLSSGDRIRISIESSGSSLQGTGRVVTASQDTVVVQTRENGRQVTRSIPRDQITRLDVSVGETRGRKSQFAGIGFLVGVGIAQLIPRERSQGPTFFLDDNDLSALSNALLLGGMGAGIGAFVGRAREDWRRVSLDATHVSLRAPLTGRGVALGATIAF